MRNLKTTHIVNINGFIRPKIEGFNAADNPFIISKNKLQALESISSILERLKTGKTNGKLKLALGIMYFFSLAYFLTVLVT